jgi:hypothetical protein
LGYRIHDLGQFGPVGDPANQIIEPGIIQSLEPGLLALFGGPPMALT